MNRFLIIFCFLAGFAGCKDPFPMEFKRLEAEAMLQVPIPQTQAPLSSAFSFESFLCLDSTVSIGSINKVLLFEDMYVVGDFKNTKDVYAYDAQGRMVWQCNLNKGDIRPSIADFTVDSESKLLYVVKGIHVYVYHANGELAFEKRINTRPGKMVRKLTSLGKGLFCLLLVGGDEKVPFQLMVCNHNFDINGGIIELPQKNAMHVRSISNLNYCYASHQSLFSSYGNDTIFGVTEAGLLPKFLLDNQALKYDPTLNEEQITDSLRGPDLVYESEHMLHTAMLINGIYTSVYFDKGSQKSILIGRSSDDMFGGAFAHIPFGVLPNDRFLFVIEPFALHKLDEKMDFRQHSPLLKEMYDQTAWNSNPILLIGKFNHQ